MTPRELALKVAFTRLGTIYTWGGDDPAGFDCSGLQDDILKTVGILPRGARPTAQQLYDRWPERRVIPPAPLAPGMLVFFRRTRADGSPYIGHVEMVYDILTTGVTLTIAASGGGSKTLTVADAIRDNAFVQIRPLTGDWVAALDPFA